MENIIESIFLGAEYTQEKVMISQLKNVWAWGTSFSVEMTIPF